MFFSSARQKTLIANQFIPFSSSRYPVLTFIVIWFILSQVELIQSELEFEKYVSPKREVEDYKKYLYDFTTLRGTKNKEEEKVDELNDENNDSGGGEDLIHFVTHLERDAEEEQKPNKLLPQIFRVFDKTIFKHPEEEEPGDEELRQIEQENEGENEGEASSLPLDEENIPQGLIDSSEDLVDEIERGIEDLFVSDDSSEHVNATGDQSRQMTIYLFQGQYVAEPRLNRFIDGAIRNMETEMRSGTMDPTFFRVLPRGRVEHRDQPVQLGRRKKVGQRKRRPFNKRNRINKKKNQKVATRNVQRDLGGGRIEGITNLKRDGDAEMQQFGNYTLIRSHMKYGPLELKMQFRTKRGIKRTGATVPVIRAHCVTRVNLDGSEMVDFLLERPHPETIKLRGKLFPLAQRVARNIFARLFLPESFLVTRLREKAGLALLSKPSDKDFE